MSKEVAFPTFSKMISSKIVAQRNTTNQETLFVNQSKVESNTVLMKAFPRLVPVGCFPALSTGWLFFRAWFQLAVFPPLEPIGSFSLGTRWELFLWGLTGSSRFPFCCDYRNMFRWVHSWEKLNHPKQNNKFTIFGRNSFERTT